MFLINRAGIGRRVVEKRIQPDHTGSMRAIAGLALRLAWMFAYSPIVGRAGFNGFSHAD